MSVLRFPTPREMADQEISDVTLAALARVTRVEAYEQLVEVLAELVRDGESVATLRVEGLSRRDFDEIEARLIGSWRKRLEVRDFGGALVAAVDYETDEGWGT